MGGGGWVKNSKVALIGQNLWNQFYEPDRLICNKSTVCFSSYCISFSSQGCKAKVDIAILLDGSGSIDFQSPGNFDKCKKFLKNFVKAFNIAKDGTHVGLVVFSNNADIIFNFEKYLDANSMMDAIDKVSYPAEGTYTGKALDQVRTGLFEVSARQGVRDVLIIMTDGASQVRTTVDEKTSI